MVAGLLRSFLFVAFVLGFAPPHLARAQAQAFLENPQPGSFQSGIGVISGWVCDAQRIDIELDGVRTQAAYGTSRGDTRSVCGDDNNGFGLLFNWNLLGAGIHTVKAFADNQEVANATVTVVTLGAEFLTGASGEFTLSNFPQADKTVTLLWQPSLQNFVLKSATGSSGGNSGVAPHILENPQPGSFQSGIGVISGWVCDAQRIDIEFDGVRTQAAYGTARADTRAVCGDDNNGFGLLFNWNLLGDGVHTVKAFADNQEFANATVTVATLGAEFLRGATKNERLTDFPQPGADIIVVWQQSQQNFVIASADTLGPHINAMDAAGDSITKGFNAESKVLCGNDDQPSSSWATSDTHGADLCGVGSEGVFSQAERLECRRGTNLIIANPDDAESGAQMLKDFVDQATKIKTFLTAQPGPRYVTVWLGHDDVCAGTLDKTRMDCPRGEDQDPNNYCRTTPAAFEREFRKGLDLLITVPELKVGVASLVRVSQLCNHEKEDSCVVDLGSLPTPSCGDLWDTISDIGKPFGLGHGICGSLTKDCSDQRITDAYETAKAYHDILENVTAEYVNIAVGAPSPTVTIGGQTVGGALKAENVSLAFSNAPWLYKFQYKQISCCDCFHPSRTGQDAIARILFDGVTCSSSDVCCGDSGDTLTQALCTTEDTSGAFVPGLF
jgi:GDSL-like lipase/acylhydrolase family protein